MKIFRRFSAYRDRVKVIRVTGSFDDIGLIVAVEETRHQALGILLKNGISPDAKSEKGVPALIKAINIGDLPIIKMLVEAKANIDAQNKDGHTPLMAAIIGGNKHVFLYVLEQEPELEITDSTGETALVKAVREGNTTFSRKLIEAGAEVDIANHEGITPLMIAVDYQRSGIIKSLLHAGANPLIEDQDGHSALARYHASPRITRMLEEAALRQQGKSVKSNQNPLESLPLAENLFGQIPQLGSMLIGLAENLLESVGSKQNMDQVQQKGRQLVDQMNFDFLAGEAGNSPQQQQTVNWFREQLKWGLKLLIDIKTIGARVQELSRQAEAPEGNLLERTRNQLSLLLTEFSSFLEGREGGPTREHISPYLDRALQEAASAGNPELVELLLAAGANPNFANTEGKISLHLAVAFPEIVKKLMSAGADKNAEDHTHNKPVDIAMQKEYYQTVQLLKS